MFFFSKTLDKVLILKVRRSKNGAGNSKQQSEWEAMSLQHLNDLQSKLMLVAGKALDGKEQVDQFVEVFIKLSVNLSLLFREKSLF